MKRNKRTAIIMSACMILTLTAIVCAVAFHGKADSEDREPVKTEISLSAEKTKTLELMGEDEYSLSEFDIQASDIFQTNEVEKSKNSVSLKLNDVNKNNGMLIDGTLLTYKETVSYSSDNCYEIYIDENQNEYRYDTNRELRAIDINDMYSDTQGTYDSYDYIISEETASSLVKKYALIVFGERINDFELESIKYVQSPDRYIAILNKKYGEDGFVNGESCAVEVLPNGGLRSCYVTERYDNIESVLKNVKKQEVYDYVEQKLKASGGAVEDYEIYAVNFKKEKDRYLLGMTVFVTRENGLETNETYYYSLR